MTISCIPHAFLGRYPKYIIVRYRSNYFPFKKRLVGYKYCILDMWYEKNKWKTSNFTESVTIRYPEIHAFSRLERAEEVIENVDDCKIEEDGDHPKFFSKSDEEYFYRKKKNKKFLGSMK